MFICYAAIANQYKLYRRQHVLNIRLCPPGSQSILGDFPEERRNQNLSKARTGRRKTEGEKDAKKSKTKRECIIFIL